MDCGNCFLGKEKKRSAWIEEGNARVERHGSDERKRRKCGKWGMIIEEGNARVERHGSGERKRRKCGKWGRRGCEGGWTKGVGWMGG